MTVRPHRLQHSRLSCPSSTPRGCSNSCAWSWWCYPTISSSVFPFLSCVQFSQHQGLFQCISSSHQVAKVLEFQLQHQSFQWCTCTGHHVKCELDESQAGIKIARRNINNLRYADDTTLMAESKEELKSLLMKVEQESEKVGLKLNTQKTKIMASSPIT